MKRIITIQHTQSVHHTNGMVGSWANWDLTELGKEQAENIGRRLSAELGSVQCAMYASDLLRARYTAEIVAEHFRVIPFITEALRERNLGKCVGQSVQWLKENIECREMTIDDRLFSDAESRRDVWNRLFPFLNMIMNDSHQTLIIVSHGDTLSLFNAMWLGMSVEMLNKCDLYGMSGGVSFMEENSNGKRIIRRLSDMSYARN